MPTQWPFKHGPHVWRLWGSTGMCLTAGFYAMNIHTWIIIHLEFPYIQLAVPWPSFYEHVYIASWCPRLALTLEVYALSQRAWQAGAVGHLFNIWCIEKAVGVVTQGNVDGCITRIDCNKNKREYMIMSTSDSNEMTEGNWDDGRYQWEYMIMLTGDSTEMTGDTGTTEAFINRYQWEYMIMLTGDSTEMTGETGTTEAFINR